MTRAWLEPHILPRLTSGALALVLALSPLIAEAKASEEPRAKKSATVERAKRAVSPKASGGAPRKPSPTGGTRAAAPPAKREQGSLLGAIAKLGPMSVGHPHEGFLVNAVKMPSAPEWRVTVPAHGYATQETVDALSHCIRAVHRQIPDSPPVNLGSLSAEHGGHLPPHKSHRSGRDVDVYFFRKPGTERWLGAAKQDDIDLPRTWALLRCFITDTDTDMILIDQVPQRWLREYAESIGESALWLQDVFDDKGGSKTALVRHVPGHVAHMHVRFVSPKARRAGQEHYEQLVKRGLLDLPEKELVHAVVKGDTLSGLAVRYKLTVKQIQALNKLTSTNIRIGQKLVLKERVDLRGVRDPIWVPPRRRAPDTADLASAAKASAILGAAAEAPDPESGAQPGSAPRPQPASAKETPVNSDASPRPPGPPVARNQS